MSVAMAPAGGWSASPVWAVGLGLVLLLVTAAFVALEAGLVAVRRRRIEDLATAGDRRAERVLWALDRLPLSVTGAQLVISAAAVGLGALAEPALRGPIRTLLVATAVPASLLPALSLGLAVMVVVLLHTVLGVLLATHLAIARAEAVALALARPFVLVVTVLRPLLALLRATSDLVVRAVRSQPVEDHQLAHTPAELAQAVIESRDLGTITPSDAQVLRAALDLGALTAGAAMTPRVDLETLPDAATGREALERAHATGYTRFPVHHHDVDDVVGLVHIKDLLTARDPAVLDRPISEVLRPIVAVSASRDLEHLLADMLAQRAHAVLVVDEFGGTAGLLSLEDVLEELVGEITDEYDDQDPAVAGGGRTWRVPGTTRRDELARLCGLELDAVEAETVSGWLVEHLDRLPARNDVVTTAEGWTLTVQRLDGRRAGEVEVRAPER
ncbi:MAG: hemolysin family protein [Nitriliruptoraceae bacterium]